MEGVVSKITALEDRVINLENKFDDLNDENKLERDENKLEREEYRKEIVAIKGDIIDIRNKIDRELGELIDSNVYQRNVLDRLMDNVLEGNKLAEEIKRETRNQWFKMLSSGGILFIIIQAIIQALTK